MLIGHAADLTAQNNDRWTPLHLASYGGQVDVARILIEGDADLTTQNRRVVQDKEGEKTRGLG